MSRIQVCHDFKKLSVRNIYHRIQTHETFDTSYEQQAHEDITSGSVQPIGPANPNKTQTPTQVGMTKEDVRVAKATAAQDARERKTMLVFRTTWIGKSTRIGFEVNSSLNNKVVKQFSEESKAQVVDVKQRIEKIIKRLQGNAKGKGETPPDLAECNELYNNAREVMKRFREVVCLATMASSK